MKANEDQITHTQAMELRETILGDVKAQFDEGYAVGAEGGRLI